MAKQKKKKRHSKRKASNKIKSENNKEKNKKHAPLTKQTEALEQKKTVRTIEFAEKIDLERSAHSYKSALQSRYGKYYVKAKKPAHLLLKAVIFLVLLTVCGLAALFIVFGRDLPDVSSLKTMNFSETTRIYDREGNVLYSIFDAENRKYVPLSYISPMAVDATIAIEDKNFYKHFGFDPVGMIRAQLKNMKDDAISQGASTITQQLAKNIFLSPERTYDRKIKELLLALVIEWMYSKEEILEMYLNKIAYGSNSYGIEAAAQTYFGKSAKDLDLAEAAVLASLPKAPSYYSPYGQNKKELMGFCKTKTDQNPAETEVIDEETSPEELTIDTQNQTDAEQGNTALKKSKALQVTPPAESSMVDSVAVATKPPQQLNALAPDSAQTSADAINTDAEPTPECVSPDDPNYVWGRKDYVLARMLEDGYITKAQFEDAWRKGLKLQFRNPVHKIEAPHFVFYIKEMLEKKYGKEMVESGGLEVKTSLDPKLQSIAEEAVAAHAADNLKRFRANNAAIVAIDPKTGQILAMVGSVDYWDPKIDGQVNVAASPRQPGSAFKPLVYALAIQKKGLGSGTILSDYKTIFNQKDVPRNSDNQYKGKMTIRTALSNSRNIPAIKAYYLAGEEESLLDFLDKIGLGSLRKFRDDFNKDAVKRGWTFYYGWPMAIGSGEVALVDLASAYGTFANGGTYVPLNPILEVRDRKGKILEKHDFAQGTQTLDPQAAFIINSILSDVMARPAGSWRSSMTIAGHTVAAKTGTSNKKIGKSIYPNNNIMIGYTPSIVAAVWVGNTDGSRMVGNAWAFADAGPIWKDFLTAALKDKPDEPFPVPEGIKKIGKEYYPSYADFKTNFDKPFKTMEDESKTQTEEESKTQTNGDGSFIATGESSYQDADTSKNALPRNTNKPANNLLHTSTPPAGQKSTNKISSEQAETVLTPSGVPELPPPIPINNSQPTKEQTQVSAPDIPEPIW